MLHHPCPIPSHSSEMHYLKTFFALLIVYFVSVTFIPATHGQTTQSQNQQTASINGYISDSQTGETLISANIALLEINRGTSSNSSGYYSLANIEAGTWTLSATFIGYRRFNQEITLEPGESLRLNIELIPEGVELEEIVVSSERW